MTRRSLLLTLGALLVLSTVAPGAGLPAATSEGRYPRHLQGICIDDTQAIYWSWTDALAKTDPQGRILKQVPAANHHGDLCYQNGRIYVAVNLGKFNQPPGQANSWVYVYDAETLTELARHPVPELVHGAGGIAFHSGKFIIVGGLPPGIDENYLYEYDDQFRFVRRHVLSSGYTLMGIQTVTFAEGSWWFGCYGKPAVLLRADEKFAMTGKWEFDAALGIAPTADGRFLIGRNTQIKGEGFQGRTVIARPHPEKGLILEN